uniref:Uncharacterized protein n=1 Tax=mine drainage metagenome TaxID=410659 RepID=E6QTL3_9ZZZZ
MAAWAAIFMSVEEHTPYETLAHQSLSNRTIDMRQPVLVFTLPQRLIHL